MNVAVVGSVSMGTALAQHISHNASNVFLFARRTDVVSAINQNRVNSDYFPSLQLNENIRAYNIEDFYRADADIVIFAITSGSIRDTVKNYFPDSHRSNSDIYSQGIEYPSLMTMTEVISENTRVSMF